MRQVIYLLAKVLLIYTLLFEKLFAQEFEFPFQHIGKIEGLPSNTVYCLTTDKNGFVWLGTDVGLIKYDGINYEIFTTVNGLPSNDVFEVLCDKKNRIWITTIKNSICYVENNVVRKPVFSNPKFKPFNLVNPRIFKDHNDNIWVRTSPFFLFKINNRSELEHKLTIPINFNENFVSFQHDSTIYYASSKNSVSYNIYTGKYSRTYNNAKEFIKAVYPLNKSSIVLEEDLKLRFDSINVLKTNEYRTRNNHWAIFIHDSLIWVPSVNGYLTYSLKDLTIYRKFLNGISVSNIHKSNFNDIWVSSLLSGLFRLKSLEITNSISTDYCSAVSVNSDLILVGLNNGGVRIINRKTKMDSIVIYPKYVSLISFKIWNFCESENEIYAASDRGLFSIHNLKINQKILPFEHVSLKHSSIDQDTMMILDNMGVRRFDLKRKKYIDSIILYKRFYSYTKYLNQKIVGSQDSLYFFDKELKYYPLNIPFHYRAMDLDVQDSLLVATTAEKGIFIIKGHTVLKNLTTDNGMVTNTCNRSVIYKDYVYTATNHGIHIYSLKNDSLSYLFESDGLPSNNVNDLAVDQDTIFAATEEGLSIIPLSALKYRPPFPCFAQPVITYQDTLWNKPDSVSTRTDKLVLVKVNALSFSTKIPLRFFYRIKEIDSNFKETREQNLELRFPHPGYFTLEVHALNGDYQKSQVLRMYIYVEPYFYQTIWFKLLIVLFVALILLGTYLILLKAARRRAQIKHETENKMRNLELSAWRSTVNPHFLFNALNTMQGLFHNNDFEAVNQFIIEFSSVLRKTIDQSGRIMISIQEEVNYLKNYLEFEKVKRHGILDFNIQWDDDKILKWYIPSMLIQPVLENSLKHGIRQNGLGALHVSFFLLDDKIRCVLHDNGDGFNENDLNGENSKGLRLITDKIAIVEKLLKKNIHFSFQNRKNNQGEIIGTETIFLFPIITNIRQFPDIESQFKDPDPKV